MNCVPDYQKEQMRITVSWLFRSSASSCPSWLEKSWLADIYTWGRSLVKSECHLWSGETPWSSSYQVSSQLLEITPHLIVEEQSADLMCLPLLPCCLPPVYFHAALFCKEPAHGWCLPRENTAVPHFLWQINPRPFLVTISVGCIQIKLLLLSFGLFLFPPSM